VSGKNKAAQAINSGAAEAEAKAMLKLNEWIEQYDNADRMSVGQWYGMPDQYANGWTFTRCGQRSAPRAEALAATMRQMGYQTAPASTRKAGFEAADGDHGLYLCIPTKAYLMIQERKRGMQARVKRSVAETFADEMGRIPGGAGSATHTTALVKG
jgi:hypothetical protein|tara:strand:+ start:1010 stop:1477 length:468 start_codon:yes stop_codon:yes gene_type:complete